MFAHKVWFGVEPKSEIRCPLGISPCDYQQWGYATEDHAALLLDQVSRTGLVTQCSSKWEEEKNWQLWLQQLVFIYVFFFKSWCSAGNHMGPYLKSCLSSSPHFPVISLVLTETTWSRCPFAPCTSPEALPPALPSSEGPPDVIRLWFWAPWGLVL